MSRQVFTGTEDPMSLAKKLNAHFEELYSIAEASGATIAPAAVAVNKTQIPFSSQIRLDQLHHRRTMPAQKVSTGLRFSLGPNPANTAELTVDLVANGDPTCIPNFGEFQPESGGAEWCNDDGAVNVVTFVFLAGMPRYGIRRG